MALERRNDADADLLAADSSKRANRDLAAELVGHRRQHAGIARLQAAHAVAYGLCVCTTPPTWSSERYT